MVEAVDRGDVFQASGGWSGEVVGFKRGAAILACSDDRRRTIAVASLLASARGYVRLPPAKKAEKPQQEKQGSRTKLHTADQLSSAGWTCAGCSRVQRGLGDWIQVFFRFSSSISDSEDTIVCSSACGVKVERRWARRVAPKALTVAREEGLLEALSGPLTRVPDHQWSALACLGLVLAHGEQKALTRLGTRVLALGGK